MRRGSRRHDQDSELTLDRYQGGGRCFEVRYSVVCISVRRETQRSNAKISSSPENSARCPEERNTVCCRDSCASWQFRIRSSGFAAWGPQPPTAALAQHERLTAAAQWPTHTAARCREPSVQLHIPSAPKTDPPCAHVGAVTDPPCAHVGAVWVRMCATARPLRVRWAYRCVPGNATRTDRLLVVQHGVL